MLKRTDKLLIGKDISRDADVIAGAGLKTISASTGMASGEVVVLDKFKKVLAAGSTIADTESIFICQGTGETFDFTNEAGTLTSSNRKLLFSDIIEGAKVKKFLGKSYTAKAEQVTTLTFTGVPVLATEYIIRVVYKDIKERPAPFTQTYRYVATAADVASLDVFTTSLAAKVNAHSGRRVAATETATTLVLTGRPIPECTSGVTDIDKLSMVEFDTLMLRVDSSGNWASAVDGTGITALTNVLTTTTTYGQGTWEKIRDVEKLQLGHVGITNKTQFPVVAPDVATVKDETYDQIVIEHDKTYLAPNSQGIEVTSLTTVIAIPDNASGPASNQMGDILAQLNPWMASCPGAFSNVSV